MVYSSWSTERVGKGGNKHEIYAATFGCHLFMTYFQRTGGGGDMAPLPPYICYWSNKLLELEN